MSPKAMIPTFEPWFAEAFAEFVPDEDVLWGLGMITLVDPQEPEESISNEGTQRGRFITAVVLHMEIPGVVEGTHLATTVSMQPSMITEEHARETVRSVVSQIPLQRAAQEKAMLDRQEQATRNGQPTPTYGSLER